VSATTDAVTLARYDWSETSQVAVMLTRDHGKLRLLAKGAKRPRRGMSNEIDLLVRCRIVYYPRAGSELELLGSYEVTEPYAGLRESLPRWYAAQWLAELALGLLPDADPSPEAFDLLAGALSRLCEAADPRPALFAFEARFLTLIGHAPRTDRCARCGDAFPAGERAWWSGRHGGRVCGGCRDDGFVPASVGAVAALETLAGGRLTSPERLSLDGGMRADLGTMLAECLRHLMGREPRLLRFVR